MKHIIAVLLENEPGALSLGNLSAFLHQNGRTLEAAELLAAHHLREGAEHAVDRHVNERMEELAAEVDVTEVDLTGLRADLTEDALRPQGIAVDKDGFDEAMARQKAAARAAWKGSGAAADEEVWFDIAEREGASEFTGYASTTGEGSRRSFTGPDMARSRPVTSRIA